MNTSQLTCSLTLLLASAAFASTAFAAAPTSPLEEARAALHAADLPRAEALLEPLVSATPPDPAACHQLALVRQRQKRTPEAIALLEKATQLDPERADYFAALGAALGQRMGEVTFVQQALLSGKLRRAFARAVELDPHHLDGLTGLARFHAHAPEIAGGSLSRAGEYAQRVRALHPLRGEIELGQVAERGEDYAVALRHYTAGLQLDPRSAGLHVSIARVLTRLERRDEARAHLEAALAIDPQRESARQALAALPVPR
jgi:tetratricopeptide (TPR) repeat protein